MVTAGVNRRKRNTPNPNPEGVTSSQRKTYEFYQRISNSFSISFPNQFQPMSIILINQYYNNVDRALQFGKSKNETAIRNHFWTLINSYARDKNLELVPEVWCQGTIGKKVKPDGILKNLWGLDVGYWESKDEKDNINDEIDAKVKKGYPLSNILFEDTQNAVLFQYNKEVMRVNMREAAELDKIIRQFISYKSETIFRFEEALKNFITDLPTIIETLRKKIVDTGNQNSNYLSARESFLIRCKDEINPEITNDDIREMMIQHILTSDIFNKIFDDPSFHKHNTIAKEIERLSDILFTYDERRNLLQQIEHYYDTINSTAAGIVDHHERQKFLKVLYENFYKVYNPKAADRLGVVYTPNEIVKFMVESTDYLLNKHFGKTLADKNVEILDPATGTGTYICEIIEHIPKQDLVYKYKNELHANEVAILPYYIANLNIEYTYKQKLGQYAEFPNICFVDTLENSVAIKLGMQDNFFSLSSENTERIKRQNRKKISVIIGNPPYNANQKNENENNKNREYPEIDKKIRATYIENSSAQKSKVYDMYARFYRWATNRIEDNGIIAFITNNSFINARGFDGFRKSIQTEFDYAYIFNLGGDIRSNPEQAKGNVFGIMVGVAITFLIKTNEPIQKSCKINYLNIDSKLAKEKLEYLSYYTASEKFKQINFKNIVPDKNNDWINLSENDFNNLIPLVDKKSKKTIFNEISNGINTARDEWVFDYEEKYLEKKIKYFIEEYNEFLIKWKKEVILKNYINEKADKLLMLSSKFVFENKPTIKWSSRLFRDKLLKEKVAEYDRKNITYCMYRPYFKQLLNYDYTTIDLKGYFMNYLGNSNKKNILLSFSGLSSSQDFQILSTNTLTSFDFLEKTKCIPLFYYEEGKRKDNITDWGLEQFQTHYKNKRLEKEDIFYYIYGVLHNPAYRKKYELNLKREFPRIPFYKDFRKWCNWGKDLMDLHLNYETVKPYKLNVVTIDDKKKPKEQKKLIEEVKEPEVMFAYLPKIKVKLRADKDNGIIEIDELTTISGIPKEAFDYKLGNRSALEWILDQYKEKKPSDPTIAEKFNTYKFADYKEKVIDLLKRITTVSIETMKIINQMKEEKE